KTRRDRLDSLMEIVRERHSYEVPEIIAVPIASGLPEYLAWIDGEIGGNKGEGGGPS
ncbi:MAG: divalent cation tolerance protein CutA, partial [Candidatus Korarchaeota archaeon]|nr:divalent cation tolerance protein CutA [Candidatus Korarchaeota archaeon]